MQNLKILLTIRKDFIANLKEKIKKNNSIVWLERSDINNTYAIDLTKERSEETGIKNLSDLTEYVNQNQGLIWTIHHEFTERAD